MEYLIIHEFNLYAWNSEVIVITEHGLSLIAQNVKSRQPDHAWARKADPQENKMFSAISRSLLPSTNAASKSLYIL